MPSSRRPPPRQGTRSRGEGRVGGRTPGRRPRPGADKTGGRRRTDQRSGPRPPAQRRRRSDLGARILIAIPAAVLVVALIDVDHLAWAIFLIVLGMVCLHELYRMLDAWKPVPLVGFAAVVGMVLAARYDSERVVLEVGVAVIPALFVVLLARGQRERVTLSVASTLLGVWWIGFAVAHAELLRRLPHGAAILIDVLAATFLADTAAYLGGRLFGRRPLAPRISPGKTVEGLFWGSVVAILTLICAGLLQNTWMTRGHALALGVMVAVLGPLGDLFESALKRDADTKDTGTLFGAHGGALDRADAALFTILGGYYIWYAIIH
ncbi:MAG TPA: phosphatidate cytidylyltransferase [Solirubrobacteraceae bacterium]|nr:phosphatidate cytidylyltransferase [Solirubrobacteraceae bacterium]